MKERGNDDGSVADISWASVFDPSVNIRALGEIQARGFRAATEVVNRFVRIAERGPVTDPGPDQQPTSETKAAVPDVDRVLKLWQRLAAGAVDSLRDVARPDGPNATIDIQQTTSRGVVSLVAGETRAASAEVWLHNAGAEDLGSVRLRCSDLLAHNGAVLKSSRVKFDPGVVAMLPRSSRGVTVGIHLSEDIEAGHYRGTLLADGYPDIWLPVVLTVLARNS